MKTIQRVYVYGNKTGIKYFSNSELMKALDCFRETVRICDSNEYLAFGLEWIISGAKENMNNMGATDIVSVKDGIAKINTGDIDYSFSDKKQNEAVKSIAQDMAQLV